MIIRFIGHATPSADIICEMSRHLTAAVLLAALITACGGNAARGSEPALNLTYFVLKG